MTEIQFKVIEKRLNKYYEELKGITNEGLLIEWRICCDNVEDLIKNDPDNEARIALERSLRDMVHAMILERMGGNK